MLGVGASIYGGPAGLAFGVGAGLVSLTWHAVNDANHYRAATQLMANHKACPSWLLWLIGGAQTLPYQRSQQLLQGPGWLAGLFVSEAPPAAKERMLFCAFIEHLRPEQKAEMIAAASIGRDHPIASMNALFESFKHGPKQAFLSLLFIRHRNNMTWEQASTMQMPGGNFLGIGQAIDDGIVASCYEDASKVFVAQVMEENYPRVLALSQTQPNNMELRMQLDLLSRHQMYGATLGARRAELLQNQGNGQAGYPRTRTELIMSRIIDRIASATESYSERQDGDRIGGAPNIIRNGHTGT